MAEEPKFYVRHIRSAAVCMNGAREYFAVRDWDWNHFLDHGRSVSDLDVQGDSYAAKVAMIVRKENENG